MNENEIVATEIFESEVLDEGNVIKLVKPLGEKKELVFDFSKINGRVLLHCERQAKQVDATMLIPNLSMTFQAMVGAKAAGIKYDDVLGLAGPDFIAVTQKASRFLNNVGKSNI